MAETAKALGNAFLRDKKFEQAIEAYTKALEHDEDDASRYVYYCNRSAARLLRAKEVESDGSVRDRMIREAEKDARRCVELKGTYAKGYVRCV